MKRTKDCAACHCTLPLSAFRTKPKVAGGPRLPYYICRACDQLRASERRAAKAAGLPLPRLGQNDDPDEFRQIGVWPWPPGVKIFEDVRLRRAA